MAKPTSVTARVSLLLALVCTQVEELSGVITHHVPLKVLFSEHWLALLLQIGLEACYGCTFYTAFSCKRRQELLRVCVACWPAECVGRHAH
jgi:hypothetical protein